MILLSAATATRVQLLATDADAATAPCCCVPVCAGARHSSSDVQARVMHRIKAGEEAASKLQIRPVEFTRGNYDARIARAARTALNALSLESYNY